MSDFLTLKIEGDEAAVLRLRTMPDNIRQSLKKTVQKLTIDLQKKVMADKLSGQVLKTRTGTLRRSINQKVEETGTAIFGTVGTNVKYAHIHEYGFQGSESVREHIRMITQAWGRPIAPTAVNVRAHTRNVNMPCRSFLRSSLTDMAGTIRDQLQQAVRDAVKV